MSVVLLVAHHERPEAATLAAEAERWLRAHGHAAVLPVDDAHALGLPGLAAPEGTTSPVLAVSLGGDGTMLRTVELIGDRGVPILGINVGLLGYLTEVEPSALTLALDRFFTGSYRVEERMCLDVEIVRADAPRGDVAAGERSVPIPNADDAGALPVMHHRALNEAVLEKRETGHTVRMLVRIDGEAFTTYAADALIVATPTGSTAYSMSARGPIVSPAHRAMLVTPVSPHMLFDRTLVLDPDELVEIELLGHRPADLSIDGRRVAHLAEGDAIRCRPAAEPVRLIRFGSRRFHQILKAKFGLADR